jgi:hypothetical protein
MGHPDSPRLMGKLISGNHLNPRSPGILSTQFKTGNYISTQFKTGNYRFGHNKADKKSSQSVRSCAIPKRGVTNMNKQTLQLAAIITAHNTSDGDGVKLIMNSQEEIDQAYRDYRNGVC